MFLMLLVTYIKTTMKELTVKCTGHSLIYITPTKGMITFQTSPNTVHMPGQVR